MNTAVVCVVFSSEMHIKAAGVFVGGGFHSGVYSVLWRLLMSQRRVIDYSDRGTGCFTPISL